MADEDINPVVLLADPKVNHRVWAACLKWSPVVKTASPFSSETQAPCKIQTAYLSESDCRQQKFPWEDQPHYRHRNTGGPERNHYFSLALAFCSWVRNGYGVFRYSDKELLFLASINGQPAVMADLSGNDADVAQKVSLF